MKTVKQISLSLKNEPGALSSVSDLLGANGINIIAFYVIAQGDEGQIHFIANDPDRALKFLKTSSHEIATADVIACETPHHPGGLNAILKPLKEAGINVDYIYPCLGTGSVSVLILGVDQIEETLGVLESNWIRILGDELYHL
ncbi:MAG: ACT domain-containing protein [Desulfatiglans sp.]|jgi:hypothetical protein|nr:ACT domain-containing protein [Desulfatiglans sp.]